MPESANTTDSPYRIADLIADALQAHGVDRAFHVPGESFLGLLDALFERPELDLVTCRHEGSAALAAVADAKLTGRPGVVMASRGPGAFNTAIGIHVAAEEAIPLLVLIGQVDTPNLGRGAVQEIDSDKSLAGLLKWSGRIDDPARAAEVLARAFSVASTGTPGPVAIELPEDVLVKPVTREDPRVHGVAAAKAAPEDVQATFSLLQSAERPILIVGGECRTAKFRDDIQRLSEAWGIPVAVTNKNQDQFPNEHPHWAGQIGFFASSAHQELLGQADLIMAVGSRMGDLSSLGFAFPRQGVDRQRFVHVYPDGDRIGRHFTTDLGIVSGAQAFVSAALQQGGARQRPSDWLRRAAVCARSVHGWSQYDIPSWDLMGHAVSKIAEAARQDAVITTDSGNFASWVHRVFKMQPSNRLLGSACGAMGSGVPSGIAAALRFPGRQVIAFCGDGGFLMNGNELTTAIDRKLNLVVVVSNNGSYGTIRLHQQRHFPNRVSGTGLHNPSFVKLAEAFGARSVLIRTADDADTLLSNALAEEGPLLIEVISDPDVTAESSMRGRGTAK